MAEIINNEALKEFIAEGFKVMSEQISEINDKVTKMQELFDQTVIKYTANTQIVIDNTLEAIESYQSADDVEKAQLEGKMAERIKLLSDAITSAPIEMMEQLSPAVKDRFRSVHQAISRLDIGLSNELEKVQKKNTETRLTHTNHIVKEVRKSIVNAKREIMGLQKDSADTARAIEASRKKEYRRPFLGSREV